MSYDHPQGKIWDIPCPACGSWAGESCKTRYMRLSSPCSARRTEFIAQRSGEKRYKKVPPPTPKTMSPEELGAIMADLRWLRSCSCGNPEEYMCGKYEPHCYNCGRATERVRSVEQAKKDEIRSWYQDDRRTIDECCPRTHCLCHACADRRVRVKEYERGCCPPPEPPQKNTYKPYEHSNSRGRYVGNCWKWE